MMTRRLLHHLRLPFAVPRTATGRVSLFCLRIACLAFLVSGSSLYGVQPDEPLTPEEGVEAVERALKAVRPPSASPGIRITITGRLLRPDGEPLRRTHAHVLAHLQRSSTNGTMAVDDVGKFRQTVPSHATVFVMVNGEGVPAWTFGPFKSTEEDLDLGDLRIPEGFVGKLRLQDPQGQPIEGVQLTSVTLWAGVGSRRSGTGLSLPATPHSDESGVIEYENVSDQPIQLEVWKPGFQYVSREITFERNKPIDWTLQPARTTAGRVVDAATGKAISNAEIWLASRRGYQPRTMDPRDARARQSGRSTEPSPSRLLATTDQEGRFAIRHWRDDSSYSVVVFADNHRPLLLNNLSSGQDLGDIKLEPPLSLSGRLIGDLKALERRRDHGMILRYRNDIDFGSHKQSSLFETPVTEDGRFRIDDLFAGDVELLLPTKPVHVTVTEPIEGWTVDLEKPKTPADTDRQEILVHLKGSADQPLKGRVQLHWVLDPQSQTPSRGKSYQDFPIDGQPLRWTAPVGSTVWINDVGLIGSILVDRKLGTVEESDTAIEFTAMLDPAGAVTGRLLDGDGVAVSAFEVQVDRAPNGEGRRLRIAADSFEDAQGRFALGGLPLDTGSEYQLYVTLSDSHRIAFSDPFTVSSDSPVAVVDVQMGEASTISGRLVDEDGKPLLDTAISVTYRTANTSRSVTGRLATDVEGYFSAELSKRLPEGFYELEIRPSQLHAGRTIDLTTDELRETRDLGEIRLSSAVTIEGTVLGIDGDPKEKVRLMLMPVDSASAQFRGYRSAACDEEGRFRIDGVEAIPQKLVVFGEQILEVYGAFELTEDEFGNEYWTILPHPSQPETTIIVGKKE